jgi:hypothetical protein
VLDLVGIDRERPILIHDSEFQSLPTITWRFDAIDGGTRVTRQNVECGPPPRSTAAGGQSRLLSKAERAPLGIGARLRRGRVEPGGA